MKAAAYHRYGPPEVVKVLDLPTPEPRAGQVRIKIAATTVTSADHRARALDVPPGFRLVSRLVFGLTAPRQPILGSSLVGTVEAVAPGVRTFRTGDRVIAYADASMGCHAEFRCFPADGAMVLKPDGLGEAEAAALPFGGVTALHFLRRARVRRGERVLVNGASGAVGVACVQLARHMGAEVAGVCSAANAELVRSLGASRVLDYAREDFTRIGERFDVIVDTVGTAPAARASAALERGGRLVLVYASLPDLLLGPWRSATGPWKVVAGVATGSRDDLGLLAGLATAGEFRPFVDRSYPLDRIVEAHQYVDGGHKRGSVVVSMS